MSVRRSALYARLLAAATAVVVVDQITKQLALDRLSDHPAGVDVVDGIVRFKLAFNAGGAFGILQGIPGFFLVATIVVAVLILAWAHRLDEAHLAVPLGLVLGGGLGNLGDRLFRDFGGRVVDFIDLPAWPVFNLADASIVVGVVLVVFLGRPRAPDEPSS